MAKIFVGIPAYDGKIYAQCAMMLVDMNEIFKAAGHEVIIRTPTGSSLLVAERNRLLQMFWESEADYMLCLDNDLAFNPHYILRFIELGKDFSAGVYPSRNGEDFNFRPIKHPDGRVEVCSETKLLKMEYVPAGCLFFKRSVLAKLRETYPEFYYSPKDPRNPSETAYCLFNTEVWDGEFWGEDYVFCRRVRNAGIDIWVDPTIEFNHAGVVGSLMQALTTDPEKAQR